MFNCSFSSVTLAFLRNEKMVFMVSGINHRYLCMLGLLKVVYTNSPPSLLILNLKFHCILFLQGICTNILFVLCGFDEPQMNTTLLETIMKHTPAGASSPTVLHYAQEVTSGMQTF